MVLNNDHNMLAQTTAEDDARQRFILAAKKHLSVKLRPQLRKVYDHQAEPDYVARTGAKPENSDELAEALYDNILYQTWSASARALQEQMWCAIKTPIDRDRQRLEANFAQQNGAAAGSLTLDENVTVPQALIDVDVHLQPGGYTRNEGESDVTAGALYEAGGRLYSQGEGIGNRETKAECVMRFLNEWVGAFKPQRILDMACSAGQSTTPYALAFPNAEVHGVDIGAGLLSYAHARAESLGAAVHFHQANIENLKFADESFDLIISHNAMHEMSLETQQRMLDESFRLLKPGGICVHQDVPLNFADLDDYTQVVYGWDEYYNGEPFWSAYAKNDCHPMLKAAGFPEGRIFAGLFEQSDGTFHWYLAAGQKPEA